MTARVVSYVLANFGNVPSTLEASAGDSAAACVLRAKNCVEPNKFWW